MLELSSAMDSRLHRVKGELYKGPGTFDGNSWVAERMDGRGRAKRRNNQANTDSKGSQMRGSGLRCVRRYGHRAPSPFHIQQLLLSSAGEPLGFGLQDGS